MEDQLWKKHTKKNTFEWWCQCSLFSSIRMWERGTVSFLCFFHIQAIKILKIKSKSHSMSNSWKKKNRIHILKLRNYNPKEWNLNFTPKDLIVAQTLNKNPQIKQKLANKSLKMKANLKFNLNPECNLKPGSNITIDHHPLGFSNIAFATDKPESPKLSSNS